MNDLRMGFKHAILQRMQCFGTASPEQSPGQIAPGSVRKQTSSSTVMHHQSQVTDFSIDRILGGTDGSASTVATPKSSTIKAPTVTRRMSTSADILDLSKSSCNSSATAPPPPCATTYAAFQQDLLASAAAANATKFYAHFFPNMFPAYHHALATHPASVHSKRYFAPYVLNSSTPTTSPPTSSSHFAASALSPGLSSSPGSIEMAHPKASCPRNCSECILCYQQTPDKSPALGRSVLAAGYPSGSSYLKTKASAELMLNASSASSTLSNPTPPSASLISLTAVTNLNFTAKISKSDVLKNSALASAVNSDEISYKCRICDKVFGCLQTLQSHERTHKSPRYECSDCGKGFSQLRNYKYHLSVHRGTKEFAAECPECGKTFNDKGYLSSHMKIHRNKKEYECPYCPKSFNQRVAFNMHVRIHTGVKPHKCAECGKRFSRKMLLKQHMRTHSGEKPYQCSVCGKSFADRSNMTLHHRLHSGIKPFNCPICPKAFTKKHHLKTHLNYHTGCKPYVCPHPNCNQAFSQSSNMRTHAKKCQYRPLQALPFPAISAVMSSMNVKTSTTAAAASSASIAAATNTSVHSNNNSSSLLPFAANIALRLPPPTTTSSSFTAGIRMLSFGAPATLPPAQQHLVSSLRPF